MFNTTNNIFKPDNLRAEFRKLLHFIKQKRLFAMKGYFSRGIVLGIDLMEDAPKFVPGTILLSKVEIIYIK